jgi:serine/threonine protein kinase
LLRSLDGEQQPTPGQPAMYLAAEVASDKLRAVLVLSATAGGRPDLDGARQLCGLSHPNLLQVIEVGRTDDELFAACEWLVGSDLASLMARAAERQLKIPIATALYLVREIARGLHAAHTHGGQLAAHGGVAPCNIVCGDGGEVKLAPRERLEQLLGGQASPASGVRDTARPRLPRPCVRPYQAADQAWGAPASRAGDVYALGAVLWELLTGRRLHDDEAGLGALESTAGPLVRPTPVARGEGEAADALAITAPQPGGPPSAYARELPASVDALVLRALSPRPEERFATAEELRQALSRELARLAPDLPDLDGGCVAALLREILGEELQQQRAEEQWQLESARALWSRGRPPSGEPATARASWPRPPSGAAQLASSGLPPVPAELAKTQLGPPRLAPPPPQPPPVQSPEERLAREQLIDGRYRLRRLIGVGGMGAVYEAEHIAICKRVALKILHPQFSRHADLVERLRREAQAASRIGHPNIVDVTDFGRTDDGSAYLAMEYLHGTDLGAILRARGRLPESRVLHIGVQLVRALAAAHRAFIVHRDLKPENVFLVDPADWPADWPVDFTAAEGARPVLEGVPSLGQDLVKVLDFGIAMQQAESVPRPLPRAARLTSPGLTVGTPEYMAPEQAMGHKVDPRADIYAVGTMLYEMLCARVPFIAASVPELLNLKTSQEAPPPHLWMPAISASLEAVILRCLARDPAARPQTMEELERELILVAAEQGVVIDPMRSGAVHSRSYLGLGLGLGLGGGDRPTSGTPTASVQRSASPEVSATPSRASLGRVAVPASSDSDGRLPRLAPVTELTGAAAPTHVTATAGGSASTVPPRWTARWQKTLVAPILALAMIVIGFASAHFVPHRARSVSTPPPAQPLPPAAALEPVPVVALRPAGQSLASTSSSEMGERALERGRDLAADFKLGPEPPRVDQTAMLIEWARRAAAGGRYIAPPGDNLVELLQRIEAVSPGNSEVASLRQQAAAALNKKAREQLHRRRTLVALDSYHALQALAPDAPFPRSELAVQLAATARVIHRKSDEAVELAQTAVQLAPKLAVTHLALGDVLLEKGQRGAAASEYRRALGLLPQPSEHRQALRGLARAGHNPSGHGRHRNGDRLKD